jgi:serine/threonine protein kinase
VALQVAAGMRHLHQQGLVHGDLKPQNILLQFMQDEHVPEVSCRAHPLQVFVATLE